MDCFPAAMVEPADADDGNAAVTLASRFAATKNTGLQAGVFHRVYHRVEVTVPTGSAAAATAAVSIFAMNRLGHFKPQVFDCHRHTVS